MGLERLLGGARSMQDEWEGYNEEEYERERIGKWGGGYEMDYTKCED